uniref:Uncharacterized protein n=1 Tax=Arundo donax TaxID=35708 RepID=A0A0A9HRG2_ARUDO
MMTFAIPTMLVSSNTCSASPTVACNVWSCTCCFFSDYFAC